jgi:hypothetical protein
VSDVDQKRNELIHAADRADDLWGEAVAERERLRLRAEDALADAKASESRERCARSAMRQARMALMQHVETAHGYWSARAEAEKSGSTS